MNRLLSGLGGCPVNGHPQGRLAHLRTDRSFSRELARLLILLVTIGCVPIQILAAASSEPLELFAAGDFDGDGDLDLLVTGITAEGVLVAWGVTLEGRKVLPRLQLGSRCESYEDWLDFGLKGAKTLVCLGTSALQGSLRGSRDGLVVRLPGLRVAAEVAAS